MIKGFSTFSKGHSRGHKGGFTLIELLVVIAIIGILAGIVLAALGTTRQKGADAGVQGNLDSLRDQAEVVAGANASSYATVCVDPTVVSALNSAKVTTGATTLNQAIGTAGTSVTTVTCHSNATSWGAEAPLKSNTAWDWCIDSSGFVGTTTGTTLAANDTACN